MRTAGKAIGFALILGVLGLAGPRRARAQDMPPAAAHAPNADELIAAGVALRKEGRDEEALATFERARALHPSSHATAQVALAHQALAHWREAERELKEALVDQDDAWLARNRVYLEESLIGLQAHLGWVEMESNVDGAEAWIGGQPLGRLPFASPVRVDAGSVTLEVRAPGYAPIQRTVRVEGNATVHAAFLFVVQPPAPPATSGEPVAPSNRVERHSPATATAGWIAAATGGGLLLTGIAGLVTREWEAQLYNDDSQCTPLPGETRYQRCATHRDIGSTAQTVAIIAFSGAAAAALAAGLLLSRRPAPAQTAKPFGCTTAGLAVVCAGTF
jgi:tetratricopeptide (TPR) repeat protein